MDTLLKQLTDMKNEIKTRDDQISSLNADLVAKDNQISSLNTDLVAKGNQISSLNNDLVAKDTQISSYHEKVDNLTSTLNDKDKLILELNKKLEKLTPLSPVPKVDVAKNVKESSTVKVQLNTKTKMKEPDDDF
jgi:chromosome segregation ATPase